MTGFRARAVCATVAIAAGLVLSVSGQTADESRRMIQVGRERPSARPTFGQTADESRMVIQEHLGLAAIDEGLIQDDSHTPSSIENRRRVALREALLQDRVGASGGHY